MTIGKIELYGQVPQPLGSPEQAYVHTLYPGPLIKVYYELGQQAMLTVCVCACAVVPVCVCGGACAVVRVRWCVCGGACACACVLCDITNYE
jgi:hypothetical protein